MELPGALSQAITDRLPALVQHLCPSLLKGGAGAGLWLRCGLLQRQVWHSGAAMGPGIFIYLFYGALTQVKTQVADGHFFEISELPPQAQDQLSWYYIAASVGPEDGLLCFPGQG